MHYLLVLLWTLNAPYIGLNHSKTVGSQFCLRETGISFYDGNGKLLKEITAITSNWYKPWNLRGFQTIEAACQAGYTPIGACYWATKPELADAPTCQTMLRGD